MSSDRYYGSFIGFIWICWVAYWWIASQRTKTTERAESLASRLSHVVPLMIGAILIGTQNAASWTWLSIRILPRGPAEYWIGVALLLLGLSLTVWARRHLATNWSAAVTLKQEHELVTSGPYRWVRHPIYTGLLVALLGCAIARGEMRALLALAFVVGAFVRKLRLEERWMREMFKDEYARYSAEVPALIPLLY
ncbi:MAG: methyltransferase family protein [Steroidobacteraceae bacterium]